MIIGRKEEINILTNALKDDESHFIAIYGRRRIGKTFLIKELFENNFTFHHTGIYHGTLKKQLGNFSNSLNQFGLDTKKIGNWSDAFQQLEILVDKSEFKKKVIFIDELSWMDTPKSDLISSLENFWNGWAYYRKDVLLIICASATSWMISKVIHNRGGLYNRLTEQINLKQFTLSECQEYIDNKGIVLSKEQIANAYMIFGGVPYYWNLLMRGQSFSQNIDRLFFGENALLKDEFAYLYASIYKNPDKYLQIVTALGKKNYGLTREQIALEAKIEKNGDLTKKLEELEHCGFIKKYYAFGMNIKNAIYQLVDPFTIFYFKILLKYQNVENFWSSQLDTPLINTWNGFAFERLCFMNIDKIKTKLGINGVSTQVNSWFCKRDEANGISGSQIDLLIVRNDKVIDICEVKYSDGEYEPTEKFEDDFNKKENDFRLSTKTKYAIHQVLITMYGLVRNAHAWKIQNVVTLNDLF